MTAQPPGDDATTPCWWSDPALAQLAFGTQQAHRAGNATTHLAFLPMDALNLDLTDPVQRELGDYELLEQLGAGGMGVVYRARQKSLERDVAVKLLSAGPWASAEFIERFRREAQSAARLQHPNIVAIHEIGNRDDLNYFSMALVEGPNLAQCLARQGPMPPLQSARLVRTLAEALHYAHRLGVLHLDLKPGNILIDPQGEPQIADFGLARRIDSTLATEANEVSGTPSYMAPEQIELRRHKLSVATDIYGLGAILYELLTGHPPFDAGSPEEILSLVLDGRLRRPRRYQPGLPEDLEAICLKCLAKEPSERYADAQALADDITRFLEGRAVSVRPLNVAQRLQRWIVREPKLAGAISLGMLALLVGLGTALVQRERAEESAAAAREQTWRTRADAAWRLVAEGRTVDAIPLLVDNLREREERRDDAGIALERLRLGTLQHNGAHLIDAIATHGSGRAIDLDRSGHHVAVADIGENVRLYAVGDGRLLWQASTAEHTHFRAVGLPLTRIHFSADGRFLVTATFEPPTFLTPHGRNNVLIDAQAGRVIVPDSSTFPDFIDATYGADGRHALLRDKRLGTQFFLVDGWQALTPKRTMPSMGGSWIIGDDGRFIARSLNHRIELLDTGTLEPRFAHQFEAMQGPTHWAAQPAGDMLATGHADGSVRLLDATGLSMHELHPAPPEPIDTLSFSNDGQWLLAGAGGRVYLWDATTGNGGTLASNRAIHATRLQADAASGTVFAFAPNDAILWQLPESPGTDMRSRIGHARIAIEQFGFSQTLPRNAAAYAASANLAASIDRDGELLLWRWRDGRPLQARARANLVDTLHFDGRHVVAIEGDTVRVVTVDGERDAAPPIAHPQPVAYAEFSPDGDTLVTASGRELRALDWRTARTRFPPIELDGTPMRVTISPDSSLLIATTGVYLDGRYHESASTFDLRDGRVLARGVALPGPLAGWRFSRNGRYLVHWRYGEVTVRDAESLDVRGGQWRFGADTAATRVDEQGQRLTAETMADETSISDATVSDDGNRITLVASGTEPAQVQLLQVDAGNGRTLHARDLPRGLISRLRARGTAHDLGIWNNISGNALWIDSESGERPLPYAGGRMLPADASSPDGRWFATLSERGVLVADRASGEWASTVLGTRLPHGDHVVQIAFASDGSALLARSVQGRWIWWPLSPERRSADTLDQQVAHRLQPPSAASLAAARSRPERALLRGIDPGMPAPITATRQDAIRTPSATTQVDPGYSLVDLQPAHNLAPHDPTLHDGALTWVPLGLQRLLGIDFDITGLVALSMSEAPASTRFPPTSTRVPVSGAYIDAVHVLLGGCCPLPGNPDAAYAYMRLHYADDSHARVPILLRHDLLPLGVDPGDAGNRRIAWVASPPDGYPYVLYAPRLVNPHPERELAAIAFEASEFFASGPLIFAATAEVSAGAPAESATGQGGP